MFKTLVQAFKNKELRNRIFFTLFAFLVFRIMTFITVPLVNYPMLKILALGKIGGGIANALTGNALERFSIIALGVGPYITASIVIQLLQMDIIPVLSDWAKEGETGKQKVNQLTRYAALVLAFLQAFGMAMGFDKYYNGTLLDGTAPLNYFYVALVMTAGSAALLWLADQITAKGIGNGTSMIIMAGIVSGFPQMIYDLVKIFITSNGPKDWATFANNPSTYLKSWAIFVGIILVMLLIIVAIIYMQNATRKIPIQYANRSNSATLTGRKDSHLPIKLNPSGVIPVIFASSLLSIPQTFIGFIKNQNVSFWLTEVFSYSKPIGFVLYIVLIYVFSFFYSFVQVSPEKVAENLRKQGSYIPGVRPGKETENFVSGVLFRTTVIGATYLMVVAILPIVSTLIIPQLKNTSVVVGGTSLLIVVGVAQEIFNQLETKTKQQKYSGFIK